MVGGQVKPIVSIITDYNDNNNNNNNNKNNDNNNDDDDDNDDDSNNFLNFSSGGGGKCSHQLLPSCFKIFVGKHKSFYADDVETMALNQSHNLSISEFFKFINVGKSI